MTQAQLCHCKCRKTWWIVASNGDLSLKVGSKRPLIEWINQHRNNPQVFIAGDPLRLVAQVHAEVPSVAPKDFVPCTDCKDPYNDHLQLGDSVATRSKPTPGFSVLEITG